MQVWGGEGGGGGVTQGARHLEPCTYAGEPSHVYARVNWVGCAVCTMRSWACDKQKLGVK